MNPRFSLRNLRQRDIAIGVVVLTIIMAVLWYFYMYQPSQDRIVNLESDIVRLDADIQRGQSALDNLPDLRLAVAQAEEERLAFLAQLPPESEVAELLDALKISADTAAVDFESISVGGGQNEGIQGVRPIGININTSGDYGGTMSFLETLEGLQRFTKISQVSLSLDEANVRNPKLNSNYNFTIYVFTGDDGGGR